MHDELIKYELEIKLLSKLFMYPELYYEHAEKLNANMFDNAFHKRIFEKFLVMQSEQKDIDLLSMSKALGCNHEENIQLSNIYTAPSEFVSVKSAIDSLHEQSRRRTMQSMIQETQNKFLNGETTDDIIAFINKMNAKMMVVQDSDVADIRTQMKDFLKDIDKRMSTDGIIGVTTGFKSLDEFTGGWQGTDLVIIGAASSMGKTSLALNLAYNAVKYADSPALIFSYEMSVNQLIMRLVALESEIPIRWIQNGELKDEDLRRVQQTASEIIDRKIYIDDCKQTSLN